MRLIQILTLLSLLTLTSVAWAQAAPDPVPVGSDVEG